MNTAALIVALYASALPIAASAQPVVPAPSQMSQAPGYYRVKLGRFTVTVLTDGAASVPYGRLLQGRPSAEGHSFYELESEGRHLLVIGDTIHAAEIQLQNPSVTADYDVDPAAAAAQRKLVLAQLAQSHELAARDHLSFPGLGHVVRSGSGFAFVPLPYDTVVADVGR